MNEVVLKNKKKFIEVLNSYHISEHAKQVLDDVNYVVLIGPAAGGRNTIINHLVLTKNYMQVVSDTTRPPKIRDGKMEVDGVNYYFRSEEGFLEDLENGEFLEAELIHGQQVSGTSIRELEKVAALNGIGINEVEFGGAQNILEAKPDTKVIAILPSSPQIWLDRFTKREKISPKEFMNRISTAKKVVELVRNEPRVILVINHEYHEAAEAIDRIVHGGKLTESEKTESKNLLHEFDIKIDELLSVR